MSEANRDWRQGSRHAWRQRGWAFIAVCCCGVLVPGAVDAEPMDDGPAADRADFWRGRSVIQVFGNVFAFHDEGDVATKYYWTLDSSAIGKVVEVIPGGKGTLVRVEFPDDTGWQRTDIPPPETTIKYNFDYDNYGRPESVNVTVVKKEGIRVGPREWGRIIDEAGQRRVVEFPVENLGLRRPRRGDVVVRGPDWRAGYADGGTQPEGPASAGDGECTGEVLEEPDAYRYVKVQWKKTGREGFYRFDKRRYYDVEVTTK